MFLVTTNVPKRLLHLSFVGHVTAFELEAGLADVATLMATLTNGCRVWSDYGRLDLMDLACAEPIGKVMEMCDKKDVSLIVRFIPDPTKNIGLNILSIFHYRHHHPRVVTCETLAEAIKTLEL